MIRLGEELINAGLINSSQLNQALERQKVTKERLGNILIKLGFITEEELSNFLINKYNVPEYEEDSITIPTNLQKEVDIRYITRYGIIPFKSDGNELYVGINDFNVLSELESISDRLGKNIHPYFFKDSMYEKIMTDLSKFNYGFKDYHFRTFRAFAKDKLSENFSLANFLKTVKEFDNNINYIILSENERPIIRKPKLNYKLIFDKFSRSQILSFVKEVTEDIDRKKLIEEGYVSVRKEMNKKNYLFTLLKTKSSFSIHIKDVSVTVPDFESLGFKEDIVKYLVNVPKGITFFVAPYRHGKSTVFAAILNYYNKIKPFNMFSIDSSSEYNIPQNKSVITQLDCKNPKLYSRKLRLAYDLEPDVVFVSDIPDVETLDFILNMSESGVSVFAALDCGSIIGMFEKILTIVGDSSAYYLNRLSDMLIWVINMRLVPVKGVERRILVYESIFNNFKFKKSIKEKNFTYIESQLKGTVDFVPIEKKLAELFLKGTIEYDIGETFSNDIELYKRYCNVNF